MNYHHPIIYNVFEDIINHCKLYSDVEQKKRKRKIEMVRNTC